MPKKVIDTQTKVCYRHEIDLETEFCCNCGKALKDIIDKQLQCITSANLSAISHRRSKKVMREKTIRPSNQSDDTSTK